MAGRPLLLEGQKFNMLTVVKFVGKNSRNEYCWECLCDCGKTTVVKSRSITSGHTKSCGCYRITKVLDSVITHGFTINGKRHKLYNTWICMKDRCNNPNNRAYKNYGGRGIKVCKRWNDSFVDFINDVGDKPSSNHSIDRFPNKDGNYSPDNFRWATRKEQNTNQRSNVQIEYKGETMVMAEFKRKICKSVSTRINTLLKTQSPEQVAKHYERKRNRI